jgi:hypothetical protein
MTVSRNYHTDNFCLYGGSGIRAGYASPTLLGAAASATHPATNGKIVLALTANPHYTIDGIRPGSTVAAARRLHLGAALKLGLNTWYVIQGGATNDVLKIRHGILLEVGIANRGLTRTRSAQARLLQNF